MSHAAARKAKRARPEGGGIMWREELNAFECLGCGEFEEIRDRHMRTPDKLAELKEMLVIDHTECWEFDDPKMARDARKYRKAKKLRANLQGRGQVSGIRGGWIVRGICGGGEG